jgi:Icc-related predicted phosphoesterase
VRILVASDLHYRLPHYDWLVSAAAGEDVDVVALVGDLADVVNAVPFTVQTVVLERYLGMLAEQAVVLAASGNHDLDGPGAHGEQVAGWLSGVGTSYAGGGAGAAVAGTGVGVPAGGAAGAALVGAGGGVPGGGGARVHTDGASVDLGDTRFTICPWWDGPVTREEIGAQLAAAAVDRPARWVWLYHSPPAGTVLCRDGRREFPDQALADWIGEHSPDVVLCGHIHQAPWIEGGSWHARLGSTWVFNAGKQPGPVPPHITLDLEAGTAEWYGVYSSESVTLWETPAA